MPVHWMLYHTLLDGRANFVYFYWPLWRGSVIIYLCILWRFLVTWVHADVLTTPLLRKLFLTSGSGLSSFDFVANSENVLWISAFPFAVSSHAFASVVSPSGCSVA